MKKYFEVSTKTIVATGLGAAIFMLLFMYVKVPHLFQIHLSDCLWCSSFLQLFMDQLQADL